MKKLAMALLATLTLGGCYQAQQQASEAQAKAEADAQALRATQMAWTRSLTAADAVKITLGQENWDRAKTELADLYRDLYKVMIAPDLTPEVRTRVTRVFPTLITLQAKVESRDPEARAIAEKLGEVMRETHMFMVSSGWLRGGGAGMGAPEREKEHRDPRTEERRDPDRPILDNPLKDKAPR